MFFKFQIHFLLFLFRLNMYLNKLFEDILSAKHNGKESEEWPLIITVFSLVGPPVLMDVYNLGRKVLQELKTPHRTSVDSGFCCKLKALIEGLLLPVWQIWR